jgi:hypothetical protein
MTISRWAAYVWAAPTTLIGLVGAIVADHVDVVDGVIEGSGPRIGQAFDVVAPHRSIMAMTLGHVVLARSRAALVAARRRGGDAYFDNRFEREAWRAAPIGAPAPDRDTPVALRHRADAT